MRMAAGLRSFGGGVALACVLVLATATHAVAAKSKPTNKPESSVATQTTDARWLARVAYGLDSESWRQLQTHGRAAYLDMQLRGNAPLPTFAQEHVTAYLAGMRPLPELYAELEVENKRIKDMAGDEESKKAARRALFEPVEAGFRNALYANLEREMYSPNQLREKMVWFWLNYFSVFRHKDNIRGMVSDWQEYAIRPNALGKFHDLLGATVRHPAMLMYLDNKQNAVGKINENYARELMELHTLGVDGGYTQQDVQELARVLTGVGVNFKRGEALDPNRLPPDRRSDYEYDVRTGFEFNPQRHDYGSKHLLGKDIEGGGWREVDGVLNLLARQPATARHVSARLAEYFLGAAAPEPLLKRMSQRFLNTDGDIAETLRVLLSSKEFEASLRTPPNTPPAKFKDPQNFVVSALRFAYDGKQISNFRPALNWLGQLGEQLYSRQTPDGYGLLEKDWAGSGQLSRRFEIARVIGGGNAGLFLPPDTEKPIPGINMQGSGGFPLLSNRLYFDVVEPSLTTGTRAALDKAASQQEWNMLLLSSPEFMYH